MCKLCGRVGYCHPRCPNYVQPKTFYHCSICGEGIYDGDEYIDNGNETAHYECFYSKRQLLEWLDVDVLIMDDGEFL